jgi:rod shape-determining protein MreD
MNIDFIHRIGLMVFFILVQVLILNHIHLFNVATPLVYVYFILLFPRNQQRWVSILLAFFLGLILDSFSNTPGETAFALTLTAFLQPYFLGLYLERDNSDNFTPSMAKMGFMRYATYVLLLTFIFCFTLFTLEAFSFFNWAQWLLCILGSWGVTSLIIIAIDSVRK